MSKSRIYRLVTEVFRSLGVDAVVGSGFAWRLCFEQAQEFVDRQVIEGLRLVKQVERGVWIFKRGEIAAELFPQQGQRFLAPLFVADGVVDFHAFGRGAVVKKYLQRIGDGSFCRVVVVGGIGGLFFNMHDSPQLVDARVAADVIFVVFGGEATDLLLIGAEKRVETHGRPSNKTDVTK